MQTCHLPGRESTQDRCSITVRPKLGRAAEAEEGEGEEGEQRTRSETESGNWNRSGSRATCAPLCNANYGPVI